MDHKTLNFIIVWTFQRSTLHSCAVSIIIIIINICRLVLTIKSIIFAVISLLFQLTHWLSHSVDVLYSFINGLMNEYIWIWIYLCEWCTILLISIWNCTRVTCETNGPLKWWWCCTSCHRLHIWFSIGFVLYDESCIDYYHYYYGARNQSQSLDPIACDNWICTNSFLRTPITGVQNYFKCLQIATDNVTKLTWKPKKRAFLLILSFFYY